MNATQIAVIGMLGTMQLGVAIPYFAKSGKDLGNTFGCTTSTLGEKGSESCAKPGSTGPPISTGSNEFLRSRSVTGLVR